MTPTRDIREIFARIDQGLTTTREAKVLKELVERLTWWPRYAGPLMTPAGHVCRHCEIVRGEQPHKNGCPAEGVE